MSTAHRFDCTNCGHPHVISVATERAFEWACSMCGVPNLVQPDMDDEMRRLKDVRTSLSLTHTQP